MPGTPSIWNGTSRPCQWIEVSSSSVLVTASRTFWPSLRRSSGAGRTPLMVTAWPVRPPTVKGVCPTVRSMFGPVSVGRSARSPADPVCAQAGSRPCRPSSPPPAAAPRRSVRRSRRGVDIGEKFLGRAIQPFVQIRSRAAYPLRQDATDVGIAACAASHHGKVKRLRRMPGPEPPSRSCGRGRRESRPPWA